MAKIGAPKVRASIMVLGLLGALGVASLPVGAADATLTQPVWFQWNRTTLDILVYPPTHGKITNGLIPNADPDEFNPYASSYLEMVEKAIQDWRDAIAQFGPAWLSAGVTLNHYVVGRDDIPQAALLQPDVVFTSAEEHSLAWNGVAAHSGTFICVISVTKMRVGSATVPEYHRVASHELGHCLGQDHTSYNPDTLCSGCPKTNPAPGDPNGFFKCPSNLNVLTIKGAFATTLGQPGGGATGSILESQYEQITCGTPA